MHINLFEKYTFQFHAETNAGSSMQYNYNQIVAKQHFVLNHGISQ